MNLKILLGAAALWFTSSVVADGQSDPNELPYELSNSYNLDDRADGVEGSASVAKPLSAQSPATVFTSVASAVPPFATARPTSSSESPPSTFVMDINEIKELNRILEQGSTISSSPKVVLVTERTLVISNDPEIPLVTKEIMVFKSEASSVEYDNKANDSFTNAILMNGTSSSMTPPRNVYLSKTEPKTYIDDIFKQSLIWMGDPYTLSIVVPILAGFLFAVVIILTLVTFGCIRRRCRRRRLKHKVLPDTVRKMGRSDRARLLAESSDEEF